jgi:PKD repeat protein
MRIPVAILAAATLVGAASAQSLGTSFITNASSSTFHALPGCAFDVNVTNPSGLQLNQLVINSPWAGTTGVLEVYTTNVGGTYVGNLVNPPVGTWQLRAVTPFTAGGADTQTIVTLSKPVHLQAGTQGLCYVTRRAGLNWINPGSTGTPLTYSNADLTLTMGQAQSNAFVSTPNNPRIASVQLNYVPAVDLVDFTANIRSGAAPLTVSFTDRSRISSGAVVGYEWDFNGDNVVDDTTQNPSFTFTGCGDYSPKLRVVTATGSFEYQWPNLIAVDPLVASFTSPALVAPQTPVTFTDTSVGATGWLWDFDNDGTIDSTVQSPTWTPGAGSYDVALTVTNGCRTATFRRRLDAVTGSWQAAYNGTNGSATKRSVSFIDLNVTSTAAIVLTALDVCTSTHNGNAVPVVVWLCDGTAVGKQANASFWREAASGTGISVGTNGGTRIALNRPILLLPGRTYGVAIQMVDAHNYYVSPGIASTTTPDFLITYRGVSISTTPFTAVPPARQFLGALYYTKTDTWPVGAISPMSLGCAGSLGVPSLKPVGTTRPKLGTNFDVELGGMPLGIGLMIIGLSNQTGPFGPLPLDLTFLGMPGCPLHVSLDVTATVIGTSAGGTAGTFGLSFPALPANAGFQLYMQGLTIDPLLNAFGAASSDAVALVTGLY